jgi:hypothetical protein
MKKALSLLIVLFIFSCGNKTEEDQYLAFLKDQKHSAKEYVLNLFKKYDIVILCERNHKEFTQYELFRDIVKDPYFTENVGHIFAEVGVSNMDSVINSFLQSERQDSLTIRKEVTSIFRDIDSSPYWHCYSYPWFLVELHKINQTLPEDKKISWHPSASEFDWSKCRNANDYKTYNHTIVNRDSMIAQNIIKRFDKIRSNSISNKKALVIMNYKHAFLKDHRFEGSITHNTGRYLANQYKGKVASVYIMGLAIPKLGSYTIVKNGRWDYYFEVSNKTNVGFNLASSPFG